MSDDAATGGTASGESTRGGAAGPIFVAGATGHTGREVVRALCARGARAVAHVRPDSPRLDEWRARFAALGAEVDATPWDEEALRARLAERAPSAVIAALGTTRRRAGVARRRGDAPETYETVDYGLTAMLLRAAAAAPSAPRFVYVSSMGVKAGQTRGYLGVRARIEAELAASGLRWVSARPSFIVGTRDEARANERVGAALGDALLAGLALGRRSRFRERYRSQTGEELGRALADLALDPDARGVVLSDALRRRGGASRPGNEGAKPASERA